MKSINPVIATYNIKQLKIKVAANAIFIPIAVLWDFIKCDLFNKIIINNVISGITNGLRAWDAIKIHTGFPPNTGTIKPVKATITTITLNKGLFIL
ncbi:MAG: hypothetical protein ABF261_08970, partial [Candidatus Arcticimaribacter sp.]